MRLAERPRGFDAYLGTEMNPRLTRMRSGWEPLDHTRHRTYG
jgi:hypothetical protein